MDTALVAEKLCKHFGNLKAVEKVSLRIAPGEIFGLVGPDGAGKTTLMRLLSTAMEQTSGKAFVLGMDTAIQEEQIRDAVGYMPQRFALYGDLSVDENINFFADLYLVPQNMREQKKEELLAFTGLAPFKKRRAQNLSGGMQKKLGLVCCLVHTPKMLFLDEPTNGVDPISRREFWRILYGLANITIIVSTPYMDEADRCSRVGLMREGSLLLCDTPSAIKQTYHAKTLEEAFIKLIESERHTP